VDEPFANSPLPPEPSEHELRRSMLRRLMTLVAVGGATFALTTWTLVRLELPFLPAGGGSSPANVARAQLEALNRGELGAAYELFSARYRNEVPFEAFQKLVVTHRRMFRTQGLRFSRDEEQGVARFTLVRAGGRWWVDDLRWRPARENKSYARI
jgi:hypothetical protein